MKIKFDRAVLLYVVVILFGAIGLLWQGVEETKVPLDEKKINLNQASVAQLMRIPRISQKLAQKIIERREELGGFSSFDDLDSVKGVGEKILGRFKELTVIEPTKSSE